MALCHRRHRRTGAPVLGLEKQETLMLIPIKLSGPSGWMRSPRANSATWSWQKWCGMLTSCLRNGLEHFYCLFILWVQTGSKCLHMLHEYTLRDRKSRYFPQIPFPCNRISSGGLQPGMSPLSLCSILHWCQHHGKVGAQPSPGVETSWDRDCTSSWCSVPYSLCLRAMALAATGLGPR